jgi:cytochrome c oxidase assembly protein subunit 11
MESLQQRNRRLIRKLVLGCVLMFGFGFALVPLYDVFCAVTGLNGKVVQRGLPADSSIDRSRTVVLQLLAINNEAMPWAFQPVSAQLSVHPGMTGQAAFRVRNPTGEAMVGQAVPSVSPAEAAAYLHKINCFCFESQTLMAGEAREMPILFVIDPALPAHIHRVTLSYTLFDITPQRPVGHSSVQPVALKARRIVL